MGNEQSGGQQNDWGFHVLRVLAHSSAANAGLEPWFDYICGVNSTKIDTTNAHILSTTVQSAAQQGVPVTFTVYSAKGGTLREDVYLEPTKEVGISVRWCPLSSSENVWHVLEVHPSSPAEIAGFIPFSDYIIGSPEGSLQSEAALGELVQQFLRRPLRFWVYNSTHDIVRVVTIVPDRAWGGEGALGFNIGFGLLHRIPAVSTDDVVFDSEVPMQTAFQLAQQVPPPPYEGQPRPSIERKSSDLVRPPHGRRRTSHSGGQAGKKVTGIEDILREGEEKSEKEDIVQRSAASPDVIAPPPKRHSPVLQQSASE